MASEEDNHLCVHCLCTVILVSHKIVYCVCGAWAGEEDRHHLSVHLGLCTVVPVLARLYTMHAEPAQVNGDKRHLCIHLALCTLILVLTRVCTV